MKLKLLFVACFVPGLLPAGEASHECETRTTVVPGGFSALLRPLKTGKEDEEDTGSGSGDETGSEWFFLSDATGSSWERIGSCDYSTGWAPASSALSSASGLKFEDACTLVVPARGRGTYSVRRGDACLNTSLCSLEQTISQITPEGLPICGFFSECRLAGPPVCRPGLSSLRGACRGKGLCRTESVNGWGWEPLLELDREGVSVVCETGYSYSSASVLNPCHNYPYTMYREEEETRRRGREQCPVPKDEWTVLAVAMGAVGGGILGAVAGASAMTWATRAGSSVRALEAKLRETQGWTRLY